MNQVLVPTLRGARIKAWPEHEQGGFAKYEALSDVLTLDFKTDVHFAQYSRPQCTRRLNSDALKSPHIEKLFGSVVMPIIVFDVDGEDHKASESWRKAERVKVLQLQEEHPGVYMYETRHGYRIVAVLADPMLLGSIEDAKRWTGLYLLNVAYLKREFGIAADPLGDWTRLFRAPHATRDEGGKPENLPSIGDSNNVGMWVNPIFTDEDIEISKTLGKRPPKDPKPRPERGQVNYTGRGVIGRLLEQDGLLGEQVEPGVWSMTCPNAREHSSGEPFDSTCRYYEPNTLGHYLGTIDCLHTSAGHNLFGSKEWLSGWSQDRIDDARKAEGLPEFRRKKPPPQRHVESAAAMPEEDLWAGESLDDTGDEDEPTSDPTEHDPNWGGFTDLGNAERLIALHGKDLRYSYAKKCWYTWVGTHWQQDVDGAAQRYAKLMVRSLYKVAGDCPDKNKAKDYAEWAWKSEASPRIQAALLLAQSEPGIPVSLDSFDAEPWLFNCANGILDLRTGKLQPHHRRHLMTRISPAKYDPDAKLDTWIKYLDSSTNGDVGLQMYLQRVIGYSMTGFTTEKCFFFFFGPTDSSKSTFLKAVSGMFGTYAANAAFSTWLVQNNTGGNRGDIVRLAGTRLVTSSEVKKGAKFDEELMRSVTGVSDSLTYAAKFENEVQFIPQFSLLLAANDAPVIRDDDTSLWNRVRRIPFSHTIPKDRQNPKLAEQLMQPAMLSAMLLWALNGCLEWQRLGNLGSCDAVDLSNASYRGEMDRSAGFIDDYLEFFPSYMVNSAELRELYESWCEDRGIRKPLTGQEFGAKLSSKGAESKRGTQGRRYWQGVRLKPASDVSDVSDVSSLKRPHENPPNKPSWETASLTSPPSLGQDDDVMTEQPLFSKEELDKL